MLDLGGGSGEFLQAMRRTGFVGKLILADLGVAVLERASEHGFEGVVLTEGRPLPFGEGEIEIVWCNSTIEHVTLPKAECRDRISKREWRARCWIAQHQFAREIQRISQSYFIQTPHRQFPLETHSWLPFVNLLGHNKTRTVVGLANRFWVKHCDVVDWQLLDEREMRQLFPDAVVETEHLWRLPKSVLAYRAGDR